MKTVAVIFGGKSAEHDVSIITAHMPIINSLLASEEYEVWPVYITKEGQWYADQRMNELSFFRQADYEAQLARMKQVQLSFVDGLSLTWPGVFGKTVHIDVVFPAMHGTYGEDGSLPGLLRMAGVPFVGCDVAASAVAMDKTLTKQVLAAEDISVVPYVWFTRAMWEKDAEAYRKEMRSLELPVFVKPVHLGSSIGITKAKTTEELEQAIEVALHYDDKVLVEKSVEDLIEVTLPLMGNEEITPALVERPLNKSELFDFDDKYLSGGKGKGANSQYSELPAKVGKEMTARVIELGQRVYRTLGCSGIARVDFLIDSKTDTLYVNEVNTLPGGLYDHNWRKAGVSNMDLVLGLVKLAEERYKKTKETTYTFSSSILQQVSGPKLLGE